jgi:hypothetical protein
MLVNGGDARRLIASSAGAVRPVGHEKYDIFS